MALGSVDEFKARLAGGGARPNLFQVTLNNPAGGLGVDIDADMTSFMCEATQLPASTIGTLIVPFRGRQLKLAGDRTFDVWTTTIINDVNFKLRNAFETWMNAIVNHADIGPNSTGTLVGVASTFGMIAGVIGNAVSGLILEITNSWTLIFHIAASLIVVGGLIYLLFASDQKQFD